MKLNYALKNKAPTPLNYTTPPLRIGPLTRLFPGLSFYIRMLECPQLAARLITSQQSTPESIRMASYLSLHALEKSGGQARVENYNYIRDLPGPGVVVSNHMSSLETLILPWLIGSSHPVTFVIKESLLKLPWLGKILQFSRAIPVGRQNPREDLQIVLKEGESRLREGISIVIFPQAHRTTEITPEGFNSLGVKLARRAGVPLVPLAVKTDAWGMGKWLKDFGRIDPKKDILFSFGPPVDSSLPPREALEQITNYICGRLNCPLQSAKPN